MKAQKTEKTDRVKRNAASDEADLLKDGYSMRLFVVGNTPRSDQAIIHIRELCATALMGRGKLDVIDIYRQPQMARDNQIVATPTLIVERPLPVRRFIGNLTNIADLFNTPVAAG